MSDFALGLIVGSPLGAVVGYSLGVLRAPRSILPPPIPAPSPAPEPSPIPPPPPIKTELRPAANHTSLTGPFLAGAGLASDDVRILPPVAAMALPPELDRSARRNARPIPPVRRPRRAEPQARPDWLDPTTSVVTLPTQPARLGNEDTDSMPRLS